MEAAEKMKPKAWMGSAAVRLVMDALTMDGSPARFVGGCVRDMLLDLDVKDVDIATPLKPTDVMARLDGVGVRTVPTGIEHGTVTAVIGDGSCPFDHFEITTLRADVATDGRHATVAFVDDWAVDAARRDFTINALFCDMDGTVYDPVGGLGDLRARRVRFVGDPRQRIDEDLLRLLRFFRFQAIYGQAPADETALAACRDSAPLLPTLSGERVAHELLRLLGAQDPAPVLSLMAGQGILKFLLPDVEAIDRMAALVELEDKHAVTDPLRRLAAMLTVGANVGEDVAARLRLSKAQRRRLIAMTKASRDLDENMSGQARHARLYEVGETGFVDAVLLAWADQLTQGVAQTGPWEDAWRALLALPRHWVAPVLPVRGRDAKALGLSAGPAMGRALRAVEDWWIGGDFGADREACLVRLKALAGTGH